MLREAIKSPRPAILALTWRFLRAIRQADYQTAFALPSRRRRACKCKQLLTRLDAAAGIVGLLAMRGPCCDVSVVLVDPDCLKDPFRQLESDRIFGDAR